MEFSEKLLTLRKAKTLTQEELAEKLNVSRQSVSKWESGQAVPELDKIVAISTVFDVTTDYLLKSSEIDDLSVKTEMLTAGADACQRKAAAEDQGVRFIRHCDLSGVFCRMVFGARPFLGLYFLEVRHIHRDSWHSGSRVYGSHGGGGFRVCQKT